MMIEPISSAMTYTAQPAVKPSVAPAAETREGQPIEVDAPVVDAQTMSVAKTAQSDTDSQGSAQNQQNREMSDETIKRALQELNKKDVNVESQFGIHEGTNRIMVKIVDKKTKEVIKEVPSEKMLDMIAKVWEYAGLFVDEKR